MSMRYAAVNLAYWKVEEPAWENTVKMECSMRKNMRAAKGKNFGQNKIKH